MALTISRSTPNNKLEDATLYIYRDSTGVKRVHVTLIAVDSDGNELIKEWDKAGTDLTNLNTTQQQNLLSYVLSILNEARTALGLDP